MRALGEEAWVNKPQPSAAEPGLERIETTVECRLAFQSTQKVTEARTWRLKRSCAPVQGSPSTAASRSIAVIGWLSIKEPRPTCPRAPLAGSPAPFSGRRRSSDQLARTLSCGVTTVAHLPSKAVMPYPGTCSLLWHSSRTVCQSPGQTLGRCVRHGSRLCDMQGKQALVVFVRNGQSHQSGPQSDGGKLCGDSGEPIIAPKNGPDCEPLDTPAGAGPLQFAAAVMLISIHRMQVSRMFTQDGWQGELRALHFAAVRSDASLRPLHEQHTTHWSCDWADM